MSSIQDTSGTVWAVFGHRFAVQGEGGRFLADLGPKGAEGIALQPGDRVLLSGERKPSEIKVTRLALNDGPSCTIAWPEKPHHKHRDDADPAVAVAAAREAGYDVEGGPKRGPKHFDVVGVKDGDRFKLHVALDGAIRKSKPLDGGTARPAAF